jgi:hypothetical protein
MLDASPEVKLIRELVRKRLTDSHRMEKGLVALDQMLLTLWRAGYVKLEPEPIIEADNDRDESARQAMEKSSSLFDVGMFDTGEGKRPEESRDEPVVDDGPEIYQAEFAHPTENLQKLLIFRGVNPLYGVFLINQLGVANREERIQAMESVLELPGSVGRFVRVPKQDVLPPGPLATTRLDVQLLKLGIASVAELVQQPKEDEDNYRGGFAEERVWVLTLADKLRKMFDYDFPGVHDVRTFPVWAAGALFEFGGDFNKYVTSHQLQKQEGVLFRHFLRLILLIGEFTQLCPPDTTPEEWRGDLAEITAMLTTSCREIDPSSTDKALEQAQATVEDAEVEGE